MRKNIIMKSLLIKYECRRIREGDKETETNFVRKKGGKTRTKQRWTDYFIRNCSGVLSKLNGFSY